MRLQLTTGGMTRPGKGKGSLHRFHQVRPPTVTHEEDNESLTHFRLSLAYESEWHLSCGNWKSSARNVRRGKNRGTPKPNCRSLSSGSRFLVFVLRRAMAAFMRVRCDLGVVGGYGRLRDFEGWWVRELPNGKMLCLNL